MKLELKAVLRSTVLCALVPTVIGALLSPTLAITAFIATLTLSLLVGYPLFLLLRRYSQASAWSACAVGFIVAAALGANMFWPFRYSELKTTAWRGLEANKIYTKIDGVPTQVAWNEFFMVVIVVGAVGAFAGLVFWASIIRYGKQTSGSDN